MTIDEFGEYGITNMTDEEIDGFLSSQNVGVLAVSDDEAPSMRPLSFWFDEGNLYFLYLVGSESRKNDLSARADTARFLVYRAETRFNWRSVLLTGTVEEVPEDEREAITEAMEMDRRPEALKRASESEETKLYRLRVEERTGVKHLGLPEGFDAREESEGD
jgi:nitroimidazol reductase NimA-like FMN-containing flavoprotein (pyridoxamine 5'-phosphate oxidase superfamily)